MFSFLDNIVANGFIKNVKIPNGTKFVHVNGISNGNVMELKNGLNSAKRK